MSHVYGARGSENSVIPRNASIWRGPPDLAGIAYLRSCEHVSCTDHKHQNRASLSTHGRRHKDDTLVCYAKQSRQHGLSGNLFQCQRGLVAVAPKITKREHVSRHRCPQHQVVAGGYFQRLWLRCSSFCPPNSHEIPCQCKAFLNGWAILAISQVLPTLWCLRTLFRITSTRTLPSMRST
jgi:hypothetical protein